MGSQSSSGMSGGRGSSSGNPAEQSEAAEPNQSSSRGRRTADRQQGEEGQSASEEDVDLAEVLAYLLRRWHFNHSELVLINLNNNCTLLPLLISFVRSREYVNISLDNKGLDSNCEQTTKTKFFF